MDRTLIERPPQQSPAHAPISTVPSTGEMKTPGESSAQAAMADNNHTAKPSLRPLSDFVTEDPNVYSQNEIKDMLDMIHDGNRMAQTDRQGGRPASPRNDDEGGGLKPLVKAYGIVGFVRFLDCYYLTLITRRAKVGSIGGNGIYTIKNTETIPLKPAEQNLPGSDAHADPSSVLLSMWNRGKRSVGLGLTNREIAELRYQGLYQVVDLTKNFYFSYTYELTRSLQENFLAATTQPFPPPPFKEMYAWNYFLTREFEGCLHSLTSFQWIMPVIHGAFVQRKVNDYGRSLNIILLARRSRHFAGTRYLKRGVSEEGKVANDVEHEQIVHDESNSSASGIYSSYLQVRGSIPTFWTQESSVTMPKPPIELNRVDPTYTASKLHFEDLMKRYSSPVIVLDLVKQSEKREREVLVGNEFRHAIDYINTTIADAHKVRYCALDYSHISKHRNLDVSASLNEVSAWAVNQTGFFCSSPKWKIVEGGVIEPFTAQDRAGAIRVSQQLGIPVSPMEQSGVLRTNCIDCLDRTNVAQFSAGVEAIGQQLVVMGIRSKAKLDPSSNIVRVLIDMYVDIGDSIALQYGGSEAHKKVTATKGESNITGPIGKHKELLTSIRRYYSNAFTDRLKQDAMNLFLGYYLPYRHTVPLWELDTDYYLHNFHIKAGQGIHSLEPFQRAYGIGMRGNFSSRPSATSNGDQKPENQSQRIENVRKQCEAQDDALSAWWKIALQSNIQQRMWMKVGSDPGSFSPLPPRFYRLYQPDRLGQFDRFFTRSWATPVRRSHTSQHSDGPEAEADGMGLIRAISENFSKQREEPTENAGSRNESVSIDDFIKHHGVSPPRDPLLKTFLRYRKRETDAVAPDYDYLDSLVNITVKPEYMRYVGSGNEDRVNTHTYPPETVEELTNCLRDYTLSSDDVGGIRQLSDSAHTGDILLSGPYLGLTSSQSAIEVATAIQEQFTAFETLQSGGPRSAETELKRRGFVTHGVKQAVADGWRDFRRSERQYSEIVGVKVEQCRRSDLTTPDALKLYASSVDSKATLSTADVIFLTDETPDLLDEKAKLFCAEPHTDAFVKKANRLGIPVTPTEEIEKERSEPLFRSSRRRLLPTGFEQINEDMYARKDNKFMVFNWAGVESWHGTQPVTMIPHLDDILFATLE